MRRPAVEDQAAIATAKPANPATRTIVIVFLLMTLPSLSAPPRKRNGSTMPHLGLRPSANAGQKPGHKQDIEAPPSTAAPHAAWCHRRSPGPRSSPASSRAASHQDPVADKTQR